MAGGSATNELLDRDDCTPDLVVCVYRLERQWGCPTSTRDVIERTKPRERLRGIGKLRLPCSKRLQSLLFDESRLAEFGAARDRCGLADRVEVGECEEMLPIEASQIAVEPETSTLPL